MKKNHLFHFLLLTVFAVITFSFFSCSSDDGPEPTPSSNSSGGETVFCKQNSGACSQLSLSTCMELVNAGVATIVSSCDEPPPPSSSSQAILYGYCDYGPITEYGGGCYPMGTDDDLANCAAWGQVVDSCPTTYPSSSSVPRPSSSAAALSPNALEVTLTQYKELSVLDAGGYGDPRISFRVRAYSEGLLLNDVTTKLLLNREDIYEWSGTARDTVTIHTLADSVIVNPIVKDADVLSDDDYSPNGAYVTKFTNGSTYNNVERKNNDVSVTFGLKFIRR